MIKASLFKKQNYERFVESINGEEDQAIKPISQFSLLVLLFYRAVWVHLVEFFLLDLLTLCFIIPNILGIWRLPSMWEHRQHLKQRDYLLNPFYIILDIPWVIFMVLTLVFTPHRLFFTYLFGLSKTHPTIMLYPNGKDGYDIGRMRYDLMWCTFC